MEASPPAPSEPPGSILVVRERPCLLQLPEALASCQRVAAYLSLVDRPVAALLARDRLQRPAEGRFLYHSRPFRVLRFELVPTLEFSGLWQEDELLIRSGDCRLVGMGRWERLLRFAFVARLRPRADGLEAMARVSLALPPALPGWSRSLTGAALEQALDRIEGRLQRGLRKDLLTWLLDPAVSG
jgi:hypothetical protein